MGWTDSRSPSECPHINGEDHRCDGRLTLRRLDEAFSYCLGTYHQCPAYQHLQWEQQDRESQSPSPNQRPPRVAHRRTAPRDAVAVALTLDRQPLVEHAPRLGSGGSAPAQAGVALRRPGA